MKQKILNILKSENKYKIFVIMVLVLFIKSLALMRVTVAQVVTVSDAVGSYQQFLFFFVYVLFTVVTVSFFFLFKGRKGLWFIVILDAAITFLFLTDIWYYRAFSGYITLHLLNETANLNNLSDSIFSFIQTKDFLFAIDIPVFLLFLIVFRQYGKTIKRSLKTFFILFGFTVVYMCVMHYEADVAKKWPSQHLFTMRWSPEANIRDLSPIGYHFFDTLVYFSEMRKMDLSSKDKKEIQAWYETKDEKLPPNEYFGKFKGKNLLVIQVESLENFVIGQKVDGQEITPNLNALLKNSLYFSDYHEQVHGGTSSDADLMTNTSVYPVRRGSTFFRFPKDSYNSLPKLMEKQGYSTMAIHPDMGIYWNWMQSLKSIGFQKCIDTTAFNVEENIGLGISDACYLRQVGDIIKKEKGPFYNFMVTLTSHSPFNLPQKYREMKLEDWLESSRLGGYFQSIHYTDKHIGLMLNALKEAGVLDNTVVVFYGDHEGVHKFYNSEVNSLKKKESWWLNNNGRVPLIIYSQGMEGKEVITLGGQIDLMPTLCSLMGIDQKEYEKTAMGRNLLNTSKQFVVTGDGTYLGGYMDDKDKETAVDGLSIADKIISGNYFKDTYGPKPLPAR